MTKPKATLLPNRGVLKVSGDDRLSFLQGLISNDIMLCQPGKSLYAGYLTPQGKFLYDLIISNEEDYFLLDCEGTRAEDFLVGLSQHKLRAKVTLENLSLAKDVWALYGEPLHPGAHWIRDPRDEALGFRAILDKGKAPSEFHTAPFLEYDRLRISLTIPDGSRDLEVGQSSLHEANFERLNGISWTKGCYRGQELTARVHYRGLIKRRLYTVRIDGPIPEPGTLIRNHEGVDKGTMRSHAGNLGLALLTIEDVTKGAIFKTEESKLFVLDSSWKSA